MEVLRGDQRHIGACLATAKELGQYFTDEAIATIGEDLRKHSLYVALGSGEVVGFATVQRKSAHVAEILWMAVKLAQQHKGIGSAIMSHVADDLRGQGVRLLEVKTLAEDADYPPYEATRRFYEKMGFMHLETIDPYPGWEPGNPCAIYIKIL